MEIFTLLKANIKNKKGAFKSIAALMAIIIIAFTGTVSNNDNIDRTLSEAHIWSDTAEMTAFFASTNLDKKTLSTIDKNPDVTDVKTAKCVLSNGGKLNDQQMMETGYIYSDNQKFYRVFNENITGYIENPAPLKEGEIYIAYTLTGLYGGVEIGSKISFDIPSANDPTKNNTYSFKVKGFIADPQFGGATVGTKRYLVSAEDFEKMYKNSSQWFSCVEADIDLRDNAEYVMVKKELDESCDLTKKANVVISKQETITYTKLYSESTSGIVMAFIILLVIIAIITMYHSITTTVEMEYVNLGILKSQGFTTGKIRLMYILQYIFAEVIGTVVGVILSIPVIILLGNVFQSITGLVAINHISLLKCILLSIAVIAISAIFVIIATAKVSKISPVRAISGGKAEVHFNSRLNMPIKGRPLSFFMGLRQFTSRGKSYMGIILVATLLVYFMLSIVVLSDSLSGGKIVTGMISPNVIIVPSEKFELSDMDKIEKSVLKIDENAKVIFNSSEYFMVEDVELFCEAATPCDLLYKPLDGRLPLYDNEIAITEIVSEEINKKIGDTVTITSGEKKKDFVITGYYQSLSDFGRTFTLTAGGMHKLTGNMSICYIELSDESLAQKVSDTLDKQHKELIDTNMIEKNRNASADGMVETVDSICAILIIVVFAITIAFSAIVINMICSKSFVKERIDIGILKSLGFTANNLRTQFAFRFMIIAIIGSLAGTVASLFFTSPLLEVLMKIVGLTQIDTNITPIAFISSFAVICASFYLFAYIAARKIKNIEVKELISE